MAMLLHVLVTDTAVHATHHSLQGRHAIITLHVQGNGGVVVVHKCSCIRPRQGVSSLTTLWCSKLLYFQEACLFPCLSWWAPPPPQLAVVGQRGQHH